MDESTPELCRLGEIDKTRDQSTVELGVEVEIHSMQFGEKLEAILRPPPAAVVNNREVGQVMRHQSSAMRPDGPVQVGYFHDEPAVVASIRRAQPHILFVAMGFPRQELWIAAHRERLGVPVSMGVGGTLDVLAGRARRPPRWVQRAGLE